MLTLEQLKEMLDLQEKLEVHIAGEDWRNANHDYALCIHMECAEVIDKYGWKHWKNLPDRAQNADAIAMELVDVWHFVMAFMLTFDDFSAEFMHSQLLAAESEYENEPEKTMVQYCIGMGYSMFAMTQFPYGNFVGAMDKIGMSFDMLYILYVSKNILNLFRQDHGYKDGTYHKYWSGREDDEHLHEIRNQLGNDFNAERLYALLENRYTG